MAFKRIKIIAVRTEADGRGLYVYIQQYGSAVIIQHKHSCLQHGILVNYICGSVHIFNGAPGGHPFGYKLIGAVFIMHKLAAVISVFEVQHFAARSRPNVIKKLRFFYIVRFINAVAYKNALAVVYNVKRAVLQIRDAGYAGRQRVFYVVLCRRRLLSGQK